MKTFRILLKSHPSPKGFEVAATQFSFTGSHGFLKFSGGPGDAFFNLQDVAAFFDEGERVITIPPGSVPRPSA
jgi:hypothetical protein